jgi:hypothetical protein
MLGILECVSLMLAGASGLLALFNSWLTQAERKRLASSIDGAFLIVEYTDPIVWVQLPMATLRRIADSLLGKEAFTLRAIFRSSAVGSILMIIALSVNGALDRSSFADFIPLKLY